MPRRVARRVVPGIAAVAAAPAAAGCAVLSLIGEIDAATLVHFRGEADELLLDDSVRELVVDLSETTEVDSSCLDLLVHLKILTCENAINLVLRAVPPPVRALLARTELDRILTITETPPGPAAS